jgi:hypothetical protein
MTDLTERYDPTVLVSGRAGQEATTAVDGGCVLSGARFLESMEMRNGRNQSGRPTGGGGRLRKFVIFLGGGYAGVARR